MNFPEEMSNVPLDIVQELLAEGADIHQRNSAGETAVYYAVRSGTISVIR